MKKLEVGDKVPHFELKDQNGNLRSIEEWLGKKNMVIYFYPKDHTGGCTAQACRFRDDYEDFKELGAEVIGISGDGQNSHEKFAGDYNLPFVLLSDEDRSVRNAFGVGRIWFGLFSARITFVVDKQGTIIHTFEGSIDATKHVEEALKILRAAN
jgi:peroxiredoxin Q/BCP